MMTRRVFLGMAGVAGAVLWLGVPGLAQAAVSRETKVMLGTFVDVSVAGVSSMQASDALGLAFAEASRLERVFSRHDGGTPVSELNRAGRLRAAPAELVRVVNRSLFYGARRAEFDVTVQPVIDLFRAHRNPSGELTLDDSERPRAGSRRGLGPGDLSLRVRVWASRWTARWGILGPGFRRADVRRVKNHLVNAGGDIMASHSRRVCRRVAVQSPTGPAYAGELRFPAAIATSGSYEIYYDASRRHHHLINPASGFSPAVGSVSVVAGTAMEADTLATALSILPPTDALKLVQGLPGRECCILSPDGCIYTSPGWASFA
ncbi:MAG: FAD:protein FMN transferase [Bilophila wadsworthia]